MDDPEIGPKVVIVEDVQYNYTRVCAEILTCHTCGSMFMTHMTTGVGAFFVQDDKTEADACAGCQEMLKDQEITEADRVKPS